MKTSGSFHISAQNIDCGYSLEPPRRGGSNEYPQSMFLSRNKNNVYPCKPQFYKIKVGFKEVKSFRRVFVMKTRYYVVLLSLLFLLVSIFFFIFLLNFLSKFLVFISFLILLFSFPF